MQMESSVSTKKTKDCGTDGDGFAVARPHWCWPAFIRGSNHFLAKPLEFAARFRKMIVCDAAAPGVIRQDQGNLLPLFCVNKLTQS
jgi:hypothetical protein